MSNNVHEMSDTNVPFLIQKYHTGDLYDVSTSSVLSYKFDPIAGGDVKDIFETVCYLANEWEYSIKVHLNGHDYEVKPNSNYYVLYFDWVKKMGFM